VFVAFICLFITERDQLDFTTLPFLNFGGVLLYIFWIALVVDMLYCLIPNKRIAVGARKHFAPPAAVSFAFITGENDEPSVMSKLNKGAIKSALAWVILNVIIFFVLSHFDLLIPEVAVLLMLFYSVADLICVLFLCPFQLLFMRNKCCTTCRIHNWDFLMMCTPMILFPHIYSFSLLFIAIAVLLRWEIAFRKRPFQFIEQTNQDLNCSSCSDKFCLIRKPLKEV